MVLEKNFSPVRVLIIDDDYFVRDALEMFFQNRGCFCSASPSAEEGLKQMQAQSFNIVVCDYRLPGLDGLSFFRRIRDWKQKPVKILISAYGHPKLAQEAVNIGVDTYFQKPFADGQIEMALNRLIETINSHDLSMS
ncbi:MAG: response regulator [Desulfobacterales bacterium]|nr:response regulator [Desulfobacterales bacterium]